MTIDLIEWCRVYVRTNRYPCSPERRWGIAVYQIASILEATDAANRGEARGAFLINLIMCAEQHGIAMEDFLPRRLDAVTERWIEQTPIHTICAAQRQVSYYAMGDQTERSRTRYDAKKLMLNFRRMSEDYFFSRSNIRQRFEGLEAATSILIGKL